MNDSSSEQELQQLIEASFRRHFGSTKLPDRIDDIQRQADKIARHVDAITLREAVGDLLCSVVQLANEQQWESTALVEETLRRIDDRQEIYAQLGRRLKVGILGGAFDPVHSGHVEMSKIALESGAVDEVWWMPCYAHLAGKRMATPEHRLGMCEAAAKEIHGVRVSDFEIRNRFLGETYHLAKKLVADREIASRCVLHLIFGRDNAESMHAWSNFEGLRRLLPIIVIPRGDLPPPREDVWFRKEPNRFIDSDLPPFPASSTDVRRRLIAGDETADELLPQPVREYIRHHSLYQPTDATVAPATMSTRRRAVMIGSFDPPTTAQVRLVETLLSSEFEAVNIFPSARVRAGLVIEHADPVHRAALIDLTFGGRPRVEIDFRGLEDERAVAPSTLFKSRPRDSDIWFVVPEEAVAGASVATSTLR